VATISRLFKIIGLFCRISYLSWDSFAKETYDWKEPTNRVPPIDRPSESGAAFLGTTLACEGNVDSDGDRDRERERERETERERDRDTDR